MPEPKNLQRHYRHLLARQDWLFLAGCTSSLATLVCAIAAGTVLDRGMGTSRVWETATYGLALVVAVLYFWQLVWTLQLRRQSAGVTRAGRRTFVVHAAVTVMALIVVTTHLELSPAELVSPLSVALTYGVDSAVLSSTVTALVLTANRINTPGKDTHA